MHYRFAKAADGSHLAFACQGEGTALVFTNGLGTTANYWRFIMPRFEGRARLVTWDFRGHGASEPARARAGLTIAAVVDDLRRVMDAAGVEKGVMLGFSLGCQVVLETWRHMPDRVQAIVPMLGPYGYPFNNLFHPSLGPALAWGLERMPERLINTFCRLTGLAGRFPLTVPVSRALGLMGPTVTQELMAPFFEDFSKLSGVDYAATALAAHRHTSEDLFPDIRVPTLVVTGGRDTFAPPHAMKRLVEGIAGVEHFHVDGAGHTGLLEYPTEIGDRLEAFLVGHGLVPPRG